MFTSCTKRGIRHVHVVQNVVVVQWRQRNVPKSVMHVQSCCFANLNLLLCCYSCLRRRRRCLSSLLVHRLMKRRPCWCPNQSCEDWTLFLCKNLLLFQDVCIAGGQVSENFLSDSGELLSYPFQFLPKVRSKCKRCVRGRVGAELICKYIHLF